MHSIEYVDCLPPLSCMPDNRLAIHPKDHHPNLAYTKVVAKTIAKSILRKKH
jgi:hypothetical protein